jgi:hypothetical protein
MKRKETHLVGVKLLQIRAGAPANKARIQRTEYVR